MTENISPHSSLTIVKIYLLNISTAICIKKNLQKDRIDIFAVKIINGLKFKMGLISQIVDLNVKQSITLANIAKSEALFWGFEVEELKDQSEVQAKRSATISDAEERMRIAKEKMATDKKAAFARKLALIEAGDPEQDDEEQVEA